MNQVTRIVRDRARWYSAAAMLVLASLTMLVGPSLLSLDKPVHAAASAGCEGGGFSVVLQGSTISGPQQTTIPAGSLGASFHVQGRYVEFDVVAATFGIRDYALTGAPNPLDITGGVRTLIFSRKTPDHRGLTLTSDVTLQLTDGGDILLQRTGAGLEMKIQAKDCAQGGVFQMEPERGDGGTTDITHVLHPPSNSTDSLSAFYFDNPNFRAREGDVVPYKDTTVTVTARVNFGNDFSPDFVGRDSPQVATRIAQGCPNQIQRRDGTFVTVDHCGGVSLWRVASGGRMGMVLGEDATEVAPPATNCTENCQAENQVRGQAVDLGHPFPVPDASRLQPRFPAGFTP